MMLSTGQVLHERYRVVSLLGQGGFGAVYRAWDVNLNTPVALKENLNTSPESLRQFQTEARLLAGLRHPNLPYVIDHFIISEQGQYLVMEYIEGQDLGDMLDNASTGLAEDQVLSWMEGVCDALVYLHTQTPPVIHRDIKPANIKISPDEGIRLVDFGVAKVYDPQRQTTIGARAVTQGYSPPEQYGRGITDTRSDIYALGATLYALLTGVVPEESLSRRMGKTLRPPRQINASISPQVEQVVLRAMRLEPDRRYQSVMELQADLEKPAPAPPIVQRTPVNRGAQYAAGAQVAASGVDRPVQKPASKPGRPPGPAPRSAPPVQKPREKRWVGITVIALLFLCILIAGGAAVGYYVMAPVTGDATETHRSVSLAQTSTALSEILAATHTAMHIPPSPTWTLTWIPTLIPTTAQPTTEPSSTPIPSPTVPTATAEPEYIVWHPCTGTYPSRLHVGDRAHVSLDPPLPNRVRSDPNTDAEVIGHLQVGERMDIEDGPECAQGWIWWYVRSRETGLTGWTAEGDKKDYWLVPLP
jgi:serine/threonine protein kinase